MRSLSGSNKYGMEPAGNVGRVSLKEILSVMSVLQKKKM
jgi:hypothetical protein